MWLGISFSVCRGGGKTIMKDDAPEVLLAGDSMSFGYGPNVAKILHGAFEVHNLPGNGGTSANLLFHVDDWMVKPCFDIIHLNCGLHDLALVRETGCHRVPLDYYEENLHKIILKLKEETRSVLVWANTTPVIYHRHRSHKAFDRQEKDVISYNKVAAGVMARHGVTTNDLHRVVEEAGRERCISEDGVHMTDFGNDLLARTLANLLRSLELKSHQSL